MSATHDHTAAWTRLDVSEGLGLGALIAETAGFRLEGSEVVADRQERYSSRFTVVTDLAWKTRQARVETVSARGAHAIELVNKGRYWTVDGKREPALDGCIDVDVAATPLTNTLPIRRLGLDPGQRHEVGVAWIDVPSLTVRRMRQGYTRLVPRGGMDRYEYRDPAFGRFELTVDSDGFVIDYEDFARRVR
ncbi:putative glycolipid-binding domain-containing protein [Salinactinospora qingdaonensis]|uniref:Glycolipid-binding n=1 Tax=Salinactinospora qingdaonensis TaxID=702744 RepID=A0ABP7FFB1_9ACTN